VSDFTPSFQLVGLAKYAREKALTAPAGDAELWVQIADEIETYLDGATDNQPDLFGGDS
jgi:hypothetical protein